jgi:hypothetical protein
MCEGGERACGEVAYRVGALPRFEGGDVGGALIVEEGDAVITADSVCVG